MSCSETSVIQSEAGGQVLQLETDHGVHAFDLTEVPRVALGRHPSSDVQIRSRRVSNYYAEIRNETEGLFLCDMDSINGTLVNEESVGRKMLSSGDRITIGGFTLTVRLVPRGTDGVAGDSRGAATLQAETTGTLLPFRDQASDSGAFRERHDSTLPALLDKLGRESASVTVAIRCEAAEGRVHLVAGGVVDCELGSMRKEKALYRLLALPKARYEILPLPTTETVFQTIHAPTDRLLAEGMQQVEALDKLIEKLPPPTCEIPLSDQCGVGVNTLTADEVEIYKCLIRQGTIARVLEASPMTDFMVLMVVHGLLQRGFFRGPAPVEE